MPLFKSILHNLGVVLVGLGVAIIGTMLDLLVGIREFRSVLTVYSSSMKSWD